MSNEMVSLENVDEAKKNNSINDNNFSKHDKRKPVFRKKILRSVKEPGFNLTDKEIIKFKIWPEAVVPYFIDDFSFGKDLSNTIRGFLESISALTGLSFIELSRPPEQENSRWVFLINRKATADCVDYSQNFTNQGVQKVVLGYDCLRSVDDLASMVLALAGVPPQHNAPNRDAFVNIKFDNVIPDKRSLFTKLPDDFWLFHDVPYDFASAGHYDFHKYTVNGYATVEPKNNPKQKVVDAITGENHGFSKLDIKKIKMLYNFISSQKNSTFCSKMYKPGSKLVQYKYKADKKKKPRRKPNKYLGIKDNEWKPAKMKLHIASWMEGNGYVKGFNDQYDDLRVMEDFTSSHENRED